MKLLLLMHRLRVGVVDLGPFYGSVVAAAPLVAGSWLGLASTINLYEVLLGYAFN